MLTGMRAILKKIGSVKNSQSWLFDIATLRSKAARRGHLGHIAARAGLAPPPVYWHGMPALTWAQVSDLPVVGLHPLSSTRLQIDSVLHASGIALPWKIEVDQLATMIGLVQTGDFVAVMPGLFDAAGYGLQSVPVGDPDIVRDIYLVGRHDVSLSPAGQSLLGLIRERLGAG